MRGKSQFQCCLDKSTHLKPSCRYGHFQVGGRLAGSREINPSTLRRQRTVTLSVDSPLSSTESLHAYETMMERFVILKAFDVHTADYQL